MMVEIGRFNKPNTNLLYQEVISSIFRAILDGKIAPGERLVEESIARELGVSRSPVRQALYEMENQGIIVITPRKGAYVAKWSVDDIEDFIRVRIQIEVQSAEYAAKRITPNEIDRLYLLVDKMVEAAAKQDVVDQEILYDLAFHKQIVASSRNSTLVQIYYAIELRSHMNMIYEKYISPALDQRMILTKAHLPVVDALKIHDSELAKALIYKSISVASNACIERMRNLEKQRMNGKEELISIDRFKV